MTIRQGKNTVAVAEKLIYQLSKDRNRYGKVQVYYDHGDSLNSEVCEPTPYMGRRYGSDATLAAIDIAIVSGSEVLLAIEIEESSVRPKTVIGDIFSLVLADRIKIKGQSYSTRDITIIVAVASNNKGKQSKKLERLERKIKNFLQQLPSGQVKKIKILSCPISDLVRRIERLIRLEISKTI